MFRTAAVFANEMIEVLFAVVVRQLLTGFDVAPRMDEDFVSDNLNFTIRTARVIDISRNILTTFPVDRAAVFQIEQIFPSTTVCFVIRNEVTPVFQNETSLPNLLMRKHAESSGAAFYDEVERCFSWGAVHR